MTRDEVIEECAKALCAYWGVWEEMEDEGARPIGGEYEYGKNDFRELARVVLDTADRLKE